MGPITKDRAIALITGLMSAIADFERDFFTTFRTGTGVGAAGKV